MTTEERLNPPSIRLMTLIPWFAAGGGLLLYALTLNHWVTLKSLPVVSEVTGWDWHPLTLPWRDRMSVPLFLVLTAPIRVLPASLQAIALNVFGAVCAALTLGFLAGSVRLMAHDRTTDQRLRLVGKDGEIRDHGLLPIRMAFIPMLFAVLVLAVQETFWQSAIAFDGEVLNLVLFAFVIYCLFRHRVSQDEKWLLWSSFVYALGMTNDWAFLGFLPAYLIAVVWLKAYFGFFKLWFLARMFVCALAGLVLYLLVPLLEGRSAGSAGFTGVLFDELGAQKFGLHLVRLWVLVVVSVPTLLPLFLASIRWPSFENEISFAGNKLTQLMIQLSHIAFLVLALVMFFDVKYSPTKTIQEQRTGFLTFYYMAALCVGYFSGYVLLVFSPRRYRAWERPNPISRGINWVMVGAIWVLAIGAPAMEVVQNYPHIRASNAGALEQFAAQSIQGLPPKALILSDDPARLYLIQAYCAQNHVRSQDMLIDTESFKHREYIANLLARYPELQKVMTTNLTHLEPVLPTWKLDEFMSLVTRNYPVYYLHPSFGYFFEALYFKPHGVVYELKPFTTNLLQPPLITADDYKVNQTFWAGMEKGPLKRLPELARLDPDAAAVALDYSVALDCWGTELQKAGYLKEAHDQFAKAEEINTNNFIARINLDYNAKLQKGDHRPLDLEDIMDKAMSRYHGFIPMLKNNGPVDEPTLDLELGEVLANGRNLSQASYLFQRRLQLLPDDPVAELAMAKTYVGMLQPTKAIPLLKKLKGSTKVNAWEVTRCEALAYLVNQDYPTAERVMRDAIQVDPTDERRVGLMAEYERQRALEFLRQGKEREAIPWLTNALTNLNLQLQLLAAPNGARASYAAEVTDTLEKKAEVEMKLRSFAAGASTLSKVLELKPEDYNALLNRGQCEVALKQYSKATEDYEALRRLIPGQTYVVDFCMADMAAAQKNKADEIEWLDRGMKSAPTATSDYRLAKKRLETLKAH